MYYTTYNILQEICNSYELINKELKRKMSDNIYEEMFKGKDGKAKIMPVIVKRNEDEDKIETIYLIRDGYDAYDYEPNIADEALEFHITYDKETGKSFGTLYYDTYNVDYTRQTDAEVQDHHNENSIQAEGYKCTNLNRYKLEFFPPEINTIDALGKYLENRFDIGWNCLYLISFVKTESIKRILHKQFELNENTDIFTYIIDSVEDKNGDLERLEGIDKFFAGFVCFNNRFFIFKEFEGKKLESLECRPLEEIKTEEDFDDFCYACLEAIFDKRIHYYFYSEKSGLMKDITELVDNPGRFFIQDDEREIYREIPFESNEVQDLDMNKLICKKLETLYYLYSTSKETFEKYLKNLQNSSNEISANTKSHDKI